MRLGADDQHRPGEALFAQGHGGLHAGHPGTDDDDAPRAFRAARGPGRVRPNGTRPGAGSGARLGPAPVLLLLLLAHPITLRS
ncbi:hypothetical protein GCM10023237_50270 [Streptomyces coeruleoprunus]